MSVSVSVSVCVCICVCVYIFPPLHTYHLPFTHAPRHLQADLESPVTDADLQRLVHELHMVAFFRTSAKTNTNISEPVM